jgi:hypothetical protein
VSEFAAAHTASVRLSKRRADTVAGDRRGYFAVSTSIIQSPPKSVSLAGTPGRPTRENLPPVLLS